MFAEESQELDQLRHRVRMAIGRQLAAVLESGQKEDSPTAAYLAVAMKWLDSGQSRDDAGDSNPITAAIEHIRKAHAAGGKLPRLASDEHDHRCP